MVRIGLIIALLLYAGSATAAECKVDGKWYSYDHPKCGGAEASPTGGNAGAGRSSGPALPDNETLTEHGKKVCREKWTKRGDLDVEMYSYCLDQQRKSISDLESFHRRFSGDEFYTKYSFAYCSEKWTDRGVLHPKMMGYCLEQELDGLKDVKYYQENYDESKVNRIAGRALVQFGSWDMAAYKVKQHYKYE